MDSQDTNKIVRRVLNSAMSRKKQFPPVEVQFNKTIKTNKSKVHLEDRKSINIQNVVNLPQINSPSIQVKGELPNISRNNQSRNTESRNIKSREMENYQSKFNFHKTIFSALQDPALKPKTKKKVKDNTSQNSKSSKSKSKKSRSSKRLDLAKNLPKDPLTITQKQCQTPNFSRENLNQLDLVKQNSQGNPNCGQYSTNVLHNQLSAKDIMLNGHTIVKENFQTPKMFKYQSLCPSITYESPQSPNKRMRGVESGLQMIRQNKLKAVNQFIQQGEIGKAIEMLNFLLQIDQNDVEAMYTLAELSQKQNNQDLSNKYLRLIILNQADSLRVEQQVFKVKALHKLGKYSEAIEKIQSIQGQVQLYFSTSEKVELLKLKGEIYFDNQALEDALQCFQDALQIMSFHVFQKNKAEICAYIGTIYQQYQLNKKAKKFFDLQSKLSENQGKNIDENVRKRIAIFKEKKTKQLKQSEQSHHIKWPPILRRSYPIQNTQKQQGIVETQVLCDSYKILVTNHKGERQIPRVTQRKEKNIPFEDKLKSIGIYEKILDSVAMESNSQLSKIEENAKLQYKMGNYEKCCDQFENYIRISSFLSESNMNLGAVQKSVMKSSKNEERHEEISQGLNYYLKKIKQLEMNEMTDDNLSQITKRRNYNITQAIKLFDAGSILESLPTTSKLKDLSVIGEESTITIIKNSIFSQQLQVSNDIFSLKQFRQVFKIWNNQQFSLESLDEIAAITYDLVKNDKTDFSILPLHIIAYTMKMMKQNQTFAEVNKNIQQKFIELCKMYPPSQKSITQSELKQFDISFSNRQRVDLFDGMSQPENFKTIYKRVQELSRMASQQKETMDEICKEICEENKGFQYKSNLKLPVEIDGQSSDKNERIYSRIIEKILSQELKNKKQQFFQNMKFRQQMRVTDLFIQMSQQWQKTIDEILQEKLNKKQQTHCYVYDLMRAKAMFRSIREINLATQAFIQGDKNGQYKIIEIGNRLNNKTKDVVLKIQFKTIVGELQLALEFQSQKNQFNHSLYQLSRSPFGSFFASFMWLTGFATNNQSSKLIFNQKLKWKMRRLQHLKKFIYEKRLIIGFEDSEVEEIVRQQFRCEFLYLDEFVVKANSIEGYLITTHGKYVVADFSLQFSNDDDNESDQSRIIVKSIGDSGLSMSLTQHQNTQTTATFKLLLNDTKPAQKFRLFFSQQRQSFASQQQYKSMRVHLNGTNYFLSIEKIHDLMLGRKFVLKQEEGNVMGSDNQQMHYQQEQQHQSHQKRKRNQNKKAFRINFIGEKSLGQNDEIPQQEQNYQQQIDDIIEIQKSLHQLLKNNFSFQ